MAGTAEPIVGVVGCMISAGFFLSPSPTFARIVRNNSVEEFRVDPYLAAVPSCGFYIIYGFVRPDTLIVVLNVIGLLMETAYVAIYFYYADSTTKKKLAYWLCAEAAFLAVYSLVFLLLVHHTKDRIVAFGTVCVVITIAVDGLPLAILKRVRATRSVEYMPFWLSLATFLNAAVWFAYGGFKNDIYHMVANAAGVMLGALQLQVYWCHKNRDAAVPLDAQVLALAPGLPPAVPLVPLA